MYSSLELCCKGPWFISIQEDLCDKGVHQSYLGTESNTPVIPNWAQYLKLVTVKRGDGAIGSHTNMGTASGQQRGRLLDKEGAQMDFPKQVDIVCCCCCFRHRQKMARDFSPRVNFQPRLSYGVHTPPCATGCINICTQVAAPVLRVRVRWIMETLKHPAPHRRMGNPTLSQLAFPGESNPVSHGKKPIGTIQL